MNQTSDIQYLIRQVEELTGRVSRLEQCKRELMDVEMFGQFPGFKYPAQADPGDETKEVNDVV